VGEYVFEPILDRDGRQGLEEPLGARRRDRPAELDHAGDEPAILEHLDGSHSST
jgi:hypothetical protein